MSLILKKAAKKAATFIADKLLVPVLAAALALCGNFLLERYKVSENFRLEKYKVSSSVDMNDSNEFMKRANLVWAKASEFQAKVYELSHLYWNRNLLSTRVKSEFDVRDIDKEKGDLNIAIERQRSIVKDAKKEAYSILFSNEFYLGEAVGLQVALYVEMTHDLVRGEELADDVEKDAEKFDENFQNWKRNHFSWEAIVDGLVKAYPQLQEPEAQARLATWLQDTKKQEQRAEADSKKKREESIRSIRENSAANRKSIEEQLRKLRFDYAEARRYSLKRKP
jgi:hypothetical protein